MNKHLFSLFLLLTLVFSVSAQKTKPTETEKNLRTHVSYLASDELEGRKTGERGGTQAAGYIANMFARYKLEGGYINPNDAKKKASFLQPFEYISGVEIGEKTGMGFYPKGDRTAQYKKLTEGYWMPLAYSPNASIPMSEIVFAGYGISSEELKHDDYAGLDVKGKIVAVFDGAPDGGSPHSPFARFNSFAKANIAKQKGASALMIISSQEKFENEKLAKLNYNQTLGETAIPTVVVSRSLIGMDLLGVEKVSEVDAIEKWLESKPVNAQVRFSNLPRSTASINIDLKKIQAEAYNVIGIVEGRDDVLKNEAIIIGAHYDHLGRGGSGSLAPNSSEIHNGADDNASGTSAMLELARQFRKEKKNKRTLIFIAFGGEEEGLLGSKAYTNNPVFPLEKTVAMINMDMVGRLNENKLTVGGIGTASEWDNLINANNSVKAEFVKVLYGGNGQKIDNSMKLSFPKFNLQLNQDGFGPSDHSSFYSKKIPVLFFFTGTHTDYHKPSDDSDKVNYEGLEKITEFVSEIVKTIDQNSARPTYTVAETTNTMGRGGFNVSLGTIPSYADSDNTGLVLDGVRKDSAADKAGIKGGDKIIKLAGKDVRNISDYMFMLGEMKAGETYEVIVMRGSEKLTLKIVPDPR